MVVVARGSGGGGGRGLFCTSTRASARKESFGKNPKSVFICGEGGRSGEDGGVGRLLWKIRNILRSILRAERGQSPERKGRKSSQ